MRLLSIPIGVYYFTQLGHDLPAWLLGTAGAFALLSLLAFFYLNNRPLFALSIDKAPTGHGD